MIYLFLIPTPNPPPSSAWEGGSLVSRISNFSTAIAIRHCLYSLINALISCPNLLCGFWSRPGYHHVETLLYTSLHFSAEIHELWRAVRLSGFGTAYCNSANSLSARVLSSCLTRSEERQAR